MRKIRRPAAVGAMAALTVVLGACGNSPEPVASTPVSEPAAPSSAVLAAPTGGVTKVTDIAGPACSQIPADGPGSAKGMVDDRVATAASHNPLLSSLVAAVGVANLGDTLNSAEAITVFAPVNSAFDALPPDTVKALTTAPGAAAPTSELYELLKTHVVGARYDARGLRKAGTVTSVDGSPLTIDGTAPSALTVTSGGVSAKVVCANIPTANATVFLIDAVLKPAA